MRRSCHRAQVANGVGAQGADELVDEGVGVQAAAVGDRADHAALAVQQLSDALVDRARGEQVPGGDRVALADAVAAILGQRDAVTAWNLLAASTIDERIAEL